MRLSTFEAMKEYSRPTEAPVNLSHGKLAILQTANVEDKEEEIQKRVRSHTAESRRRVTSRNLQQHYRNIYPTYAKKRV